MFIKGVEFRLPTSDELVGKYTALVKRAAALLAGVVFVGIVATGQAGAQEVCGTTTWDLTAGQTEVVGTVTVENDSDYLYVTYELTDPDATFGTLHLWVGNDINNVPANPQGTPVPGLFPHHYDATGSTSYTFVLSFKDDLAIQDITEVCGATLYVVTHAEVTIDDTGGDPRHETAWGGDNEGPGPRWWFYGVYSICCPNDEPPPDVGACETAFAKGGWVFVTSSKANPEDLPSLNLTRNRWGWAIKQYVGTEEYEIWQGAGLNRTSKGDLVGRLTVDYDGTIVKITYEIDPDYVMKELHVYVGDTKPTTIAPGQYGYTQYFDPAVQTHEAQFEVIGNKVWIIAHAVTCAAEE